MSLQGEINKVSGNIRRSIVQIANRGLNGKNNYAIGTKKVFGYVCDIHEEGDLAGTVDVQEYDFVPGELPTPGAGFHEGVLLSAIQDNSGGFLIVPMMFSEVVITKNPIDGREYVVMYSRVKRMQLVTDAIESEEGDGEIKIGVTEVKDFQESDDGLELDYNELEPTKNKTETIYARDSITHHIISPDDEEGFEEVTTVEKKTLTVKDTSVTIDGESVDISTTSNIHIKIGETEITKEDGKVIVKTGSTTLTQENGKVNIETQNCEIKGSQVKVEGSQVQITGGTLTVQGQSSVDLNGPFNAIKACPFSGAPHCGSIVSGT